MDSFEYLRAVARSGLPRGLRDYLRALLTWVDLEAWECWPSASTVAGAMGVDVSTVRRWTREARRLHLIEERGTMPSGQFRFRVNIERLRALADAPPGTPADDDQQPEPETDPAPKPEGGPTPSQDAPLPVAPCDAPPRTVQPHPSHSAPPTAQRTGHRTDQQQHATPPLALAPAPAPAPPAAAAAVADLLNSTELLQHPNATLERLAWIAEVAPTKTNPAGWAAAAIRKGFTPPPKPSAEIEADRKRKRIAANKAAFARAQTMSQADRDALWAAVRARWPNLNKRNPDHAVSIRSGAGEIMLEWEADGTVTRDTPPRIVPQIEPQIGPQIGPQIEPQIGPEIEQ
ncbi:MAG: helix-turn-helix domain-containing protein [Planctomycetota bacterium]